MKRKTLKQSIKAIKLKRIENKLQTYIEALTTLVVLMGTYSYISLLEFDKITCLDFIKGIACFMMYLFIGYYILTKINEFITNILFPN